jgi:carbon-monoxide dehydrogenase medium subunit
VSFTCQVPRSLDEALAVLADLPSSQVLAGGTDVGVQYLRGEIAPEHVLYIGGLDALRGQESNGVLRVGALTTHRELAVHATVRSRFAALADAAGQVGGRQTQNIGTIGGNLVNASPAADLPPALLIADARVTLTSVAGERELELSDFFRGRRLTARRADELLTSVTLTPPPPVSGEAYVKLGRRRAMEIAIVGVAVRLTFDENLREVRDARVAVCAAAQIPYRAIEAERRLIGAELDAETLAEAGRLAAGLASPIDDVRASADYRTRVIGSLLIRAANRCRERAHSTRSGDRP